LKAALQAALALLRPPKTAGLLSLQQPIIHKISQFVSNEFPFNYIRRHLS